MMGTKDDWIKLKENVAALSKFDLEFWISKLLPVLDKFIEAASGKIDKTFWDCCYKAHSGGSGVATTVKGWVTLFYPYDSSDKKMKLNTLDDIYNLYKNKKNVGNIKESKIPCGLTETPLKWFY